MKNLLFNDVRMIIIMMQVLDATETYVMRENIKAKYAYGYNSKRFNAVNGLCIWMHIIIIIIITCDQAQLFQALLVYFSK